MALIGCGIIDPDKFTYRCPELEHANSFSRWKWHSPFRPKYGGSWREWIFMRKSDVGELEGHPRNIVEVTWLRVFGVLRVTRTKKPKPLGGESIFGILDDEQGILIQTTREAHIERDSKSQVYYAKESPITSSKK